VLAISSRETFSATPARLCRRRTAPSLAQDAVGRGDVGALVPVERRFLYLPFEHAESDTAQQRSVELFTRLSQETGLTDPLEWAQRHAAIIRRFGRFPHRNAIVGRVSTPEEIAFLAAPGSGF
jgi:uncharacterized protein (DUF924 family)